MQRKMGYYFALIFWALAVCTILSISIEQQMTAKVVVSKTEQGRLSELDVWELPLNALMLDDEGSHLYEVVRGSGWETGARVQEVNPAFYVIEENRVVIASGVTGKYIQYTSKEIMPGGLVQEVKPYKGKRENYLVIMPKGAEVSETEWTDEEILERKNNVLLLSMEETLPYMENLIENKLGLCKENRIYCMGDFGEFLNSIPLLATMLVFFLHSIMLWMYSYILSRRPLINRRILMGNVGLELILLYGFTRITQAVSLPSSLLPRNNILNLKHYKCEFTEILGALKLLSHEEAIEALGAFHKDMWLAGIVIVLGIVCGRIVLVVEYWICEKSKKVIV